MSLVSDENKRGFFDRLKNAVSDILPGDAPKKGPPPPRKPDQGSASDGFKRTAELGRPKATGGLNEARATARLNGASVGPPEHDLSPRRLAMIEDYMKGEFKLEVMKDPAYMYKIVSDERAYQTRLLFEWKKRMQSMPAGSPKAEELQAKIKRAQSIVTNLFKVLKRITGTQGSTGGTDFLSDNK